jgi:acyl-CoA synthetase (AMP-forming)/AMP-acid ligase II
MNLFDYLLSDSKKLKKDLLLGDKKTISYQDIYWESLKFAFYLQNEIGENQHVILISRNSASFIIAYLGIIKSGNICIPINPEIEQRNLNYIVKSTNCNLLVDFEGKSEELELPVSICLTSNDFLGILGTIDKESISLSDDFDENRIAEIIFTSGSTGNPKGVMLSHLNIISNTDSILDYLKLSSSDIMEVVLPFYYCYGLSLLHTHLKVGGSLVLIRNFMFLGDVLSSLTKYKCTGFAGVPSHFQILLKKSRDFKNMEFPQLRYVTQAGGKLHNVFLEEFKDAFPKVEFFVMYGQTEAAARLSYLPTELFRQKMGSIGKGMKGVSLKVVNLEGEPVSVGEIGEVIARGDNVMKAYYKETESTAKVLQDGWLYTGDLGKVDNDGFIFLVGRKKEILKVRGKRVSSKEIEEVVLSVVEVLDCTIKGEFDELLGETIHAHIVLKDQYDASLVREKIVKRCHEKLQAHKIPQIITFDSKMNINSTGKKKPTKF